MSKDISFEEAINKLQSIVEQLENGNESLESSLELFEQGTNIASLCNKILTNAKQKVITLSEVEEINAKLGEKLDGSNK